MVWALTLGFVYNMSLGCVNNAMIMGNGCESLSEFTVNSAVHYQFARASKQVTGKKPMTGAIYI
jgi:hypothetical protein